MDRYEQLIEFVINDEQQKAKELFHEIIVEKSRQIYEDLMAQDSPGGDKVDDFIDNVSVDEKGVDDDNNNFDGGNLSSEQPDLELSSNNDWNNIANGGEAEPNSNSESMEDRIVDLEAQLASLIAQLEELSAAKEEIAPESEHEAPEASEEPELHAEPEEHEEPELHSEPEDRVTARVRPDDSENVAAEKAGISEATQLINAPGYIKTEDGKVYTTSTVLANSGGRVMKHRTPVRFSDSVENGRSAPDVAVKRGNDFQNTPSKTSRRLRNAPKPFLKQSPGSNNRSVM